MSEGCYFCGAVIREGDRIGGWVAFIYRSFPYCIKCAADHDLGDEVEQ